MPVYFADSIAIPNAQSFSNLFQSIENSPTARGYEIAIAQFNGFLGYDCENSRGVSKFRWDTLSNQFNLEWTNDTINMNGVLAYSSGSNLVYGTGKEEDCNYYYYGLDWNTGAISLRYLLGEEESFPDDPFYDQGVNHIIDEDGSIYYSGSRSLVKLERHPISLSASGGDTTMELKLYPNPSGGMLFFDGIDMVAWRMEVFNLQGQKLMDQILSHNSVDLRSLETGIYLIYLSKENLHHSQMVILNKQD
jgi:hypothetical protein